MKNEDYYLKQIAKSLNKKSTHSGFNVLITLIVLGVSIIIWLIYKVIKIIIKAVKKIMKENEEKRLKEIEHDKAVHQLTSLLRANYYNISFTPLQTTINNNGNMTQYVNFYAYNKLNGCIENINRLINKVLYDSLLVSTKKNDLYNSIIIEDTAMEQIKEDIKNVTGCNILIKYIEETKNLAEV